MSRCWPGLLTLVVLVGCGGGGGDPSDPATKGSASPSPGKAATVTCRPVTARRGDGADLRRIRVGRTVNLRPGDGRRFSLTLTKVETANRITRRFGGEGVFEPRRADFILVRYRLRNTGTRQIEGASSVNAAFLLSPRGGGRALVRADKDEPCAVISASAAKRTGDVSPEEDLRPGQATDTLVVYSPVTPHGRYDWVSTELGVKAAVDLR